MMLSEETRKRAEEGEETGGSRDYEMGPASDLELWADKGEAATCGQPGEEGPPPKPSVHRQKETVYISGPSSPGDRKSVV